MILVADSGSTNTNWVIIEGNKIIISGFHVSGYVGGLLSTEIANKPFTSGSLTIKIVNKKGVIENLKEVRKFYSTSVKIKSIPNIIFFIIKIVFYFCRRVLRIIDRHLFFSLV